MPLDVFPPSLEKSAPRTDLSNTMDSSSKRAVGADYLRSQNAEYIDELYQRYLADPTSIDDTWRYFFDGIELGQESSSVVQTVSTAPQVGATAAAPQATSTNALALEASVYLLIQAYRQYGHLAAQTNPLAQGPTAAVELELSRFGLDASHLQQKFQAGKHVGLGTTATLQDILGLLKATYCGSIATELGVIQSLEQRQWLETRLEKTRGRTAFAVDTKKRILERLTRSEALERFLHTRYVGQKRFSIEGAEALIPGIEHAIDKAAQSGATEAVIGMAHRGRLNVLCNTLGKPVEDLFVEFEDKYEVDRSHGDGDVKYHMGYSRDWTTPSGKAMHLSLAFNPSHLEFANAVVEGMAAAKQRLKGDAVGKTVLPILIHGDAAFAGQGVVYETLAMAQLPAYTTGGTLHIVANNQVGFTTSPHDGRSTRYCTDLAKMLEAPILHVNGDDPEAFLTAVEIAQEYRDTFHRDFFIDLICYRKYGHNEGDEPSFTQPVLYKKIQEHQTPREVYAGLLAAEGSVPAAESQALLDLVNAEMLAAQAKAKARTQKTAIRCFEGRWKNFETPHHQKDLFTPVDTRVAKATLLQISEQLNAIPKDFGLHPKLGRFFEARQKAVVEGAGIDWGNGESLAYATLLKEGHWVRIAGQDAERGTFTHRHSVLTDVTNGRRITPLRAMTTASPASAFQLQIYNSHLSETAALGFEYGWAITDPNTLDIWEAQFGDFANGAQVIIDQFIASSETKWNRANGTVLLLPHGFEGQGPEHSSARLERFLQLSGGDNLFVCNFTTPAQLFHAMRRHMKRPFRKPMVVMSPKSLLRHPLAVSALTDFTDGGFQEVIQDAVAAQAGSAVRRVILCSGKIYYDLVQERDRLKEQNKKDPGVALLRVEQIAPFPRDSLVAALAAFPKAEIVWAQEEPRNMGAWSYVFQQWCGGLDDLRKDVGGREIRYIGRIMASSPAVGSNRLHHQEQKQILTLAFE